MSQESVLKEIRAAVKAAKTEAGERGAVLRTLASHGSVVIPRVEQSRADDGRSVRVYIFTGTKAGDFALITGPGVIGTVADLADLAYAKAQPGVYVQAVTSKSPIVQETVAMAKRLAAAEGATVKHAPAAAAPRAPRAPRAAPVRAAESPRFPHRDETHFPARGPAAPRPVPGGLPFQPPHVPARVPYDRPALPPMPRPRPTPAGRSYQPPHVPRRPAPAPAPAPSGGGSDADMMAMFKELMMAKIAARAGK